MDKTNQQTYKTLSVHSSPFHLEKDWKLFCENKNKNCSQKEIDILIAKEILNTIDLEIMRILAEYGYVNTYNITYALSTRLPDSYKKDSYQRNFRKMVRAGILLKQCIHADDSPTAPYATPLRIYSLSPGAHTYMAPHISVPFPNRLVLSQTCVLDCLAVSQLLIHFLDTYSDQCTVRPFIYRRIGNQHNIIFDGIIRFNVADKMPQLPLQIILISIRDSPNTFTKYTSHVAAAQKVAAIDTKKYRTIIVIVTESLNLIRTLVKYLPLSTDDKNFYAPVYFTFDSLLFADTLFTSLFTAAPDDNGNISTLERIRFNA